MRLHLCALVMAGTIGAGCDGSPVQPRTESALSLASNPPPAPRDPDPTPPAPTEPAPNPPAPAPVAEFGTIVVEVLPFSYSNPCTGPARDQCEPRGRVVVDDSDRPQSFAGPATLTWTDLPAGEHTLRILSGVYPSGDSDCRFFLRRLGDRTSYGLPLNVFLRAGETQKFEVPFICI
jgi:hypothetical protein